jgi:Protein of unknown function (DUF2934)
MLDKSRTLDKQPPVELATDYLGETRHEFVAKLAYKLWEQRGRPLGSPDVDWFAAEQAMYSLLAAAGMITPSPNDLQDIAEKIYH